MRLDPKLDKAFRDNNYALRAQFGLYRLLFGKQVRFVTDRARRKAAICSRRAGKSTAAAMYLCETAIRHPGSIGVYIALTRISAKRILWPALRKLNTQEDLGMTFNTSELTCTFANGSQIWLTGAEDESDIEKLRGPAYHLVIVDEAASFGPHLEAMIDEVLDPALLDHNGVLCLIGTPGAACVGKFHDVTTIPDCGWSVHRWSVLDNPHLPRAREWLEKKCRDNRWAADNPVYRREWLGEWVRDDDSMVYHWTDENLIDVIPTHGLIHVLGIDLGFNDKTAFSMVSSSINDPLCYVHDGMKVARMDVTSVANKAKEYMARWECHRIVIDCGGLGRMISEELSVRHGIPCEAAEKTEKVAAIELFNADLRLQRAKVVRGHPCLDEWAVMQWDEQRKKEDPRYPNDVSDATTYAYREAIHWAHRAPPVRHKTGSPEQLAAEEAAMEEYDMQVEEMTYAEMLA